ncbi:flavin reductase family protein [Rhodococcus zopfii]|uniref:flavin reductase family protein n=1 Tax=Rhodococcus zopfii TaxID=43772 RepID=UPI0011114705|nr:flavin reductase family protein [Rhodococcus zopfii]
MLPADAPSPSRTRIDPRAIRPSQAYRLLTASIVPRPIAWVSTRSVEGTHNLAPYSFFTVASSEPPILQITSIGHKDTWRNIVDTGQFVVNIGTETLIDQMNTTSAPFDSSVDEFEAAGLTPIDSEVVAAPQVAEAPIAFECEKQLILEVGNGTIILGLVVGISMSNDVLADDGLPDFGRLAPPSRLGRTEWGLAPQTTIRDRPRATG